MKTAIDVVCPKCQAGITAKCTKRVQFGRQFTDLFCQERIDLAAYLNKQEDRLHAKENLNL